MASSACMHPCPHMHGAPCAARCATEVWIERLAALEAALDIILLVTLGLATMPLHYFLLDGVKIEKALRAKEELKASELRRPGGKPRPKRL